MKYLNQPFKLKNKNTSGCESSVILSLPLFLTKKVLRIRVHTQKSGHSVIGWG